jgi:hypothetical protein
MSYNILSIFHPTSSSIGILSFLFVNLIAMEYTIRKRKRLQFSKEEDEKLNFKQTSGIYICFNMYISDYAYMIKCMYMCMCLYVFLNLYLFICIEREVYIYVYVYILSCI